MNTKGFHHHGDTVTYTAYPHKYSTTHLTMHGVWKIKKIFFAYYRFISELAFSKNHHVHIS